MSTSDHAVRQYLGRYAHESAHAPWPFTQRHFAHVVVVPAYSESAMFIEHAFNEHAHSSVLLIVVANAPEDAKPDTVARTQALLRCPPPAPLVRQAVGTDVIWDHPDTPFAVWLIDHARSGHRLPPDQGVGLARKIGMDRAVAAIARDDVRTSMIHCNDADGQWPANYFAAQPNTGDSALTFGFEHVGAQAQTPAQHVYDLRIRDHPASLSAAGSGYGFQALGSAMAVEASHYARVRGCPRRAAGEDFHLLAKLAKTGTIRHCREITVRIRARASLRVPFGTGPAVARLQTLDDPFTDPMFYAQRSYRLLSAFLQLIDDLLRGSRESLAVPALSKSLETLLATSREVHLPVEVFEVQACAQALERAHDASDDLAQRGRQFHTWFDALRTLRLMHRLRDAGLVNVDATTLRTQHPERYARAANQ